MSDKPIISSDTGYELIAKMLDDERFAGKVDEQSLDAFANMREREHTLTTKQLLWVQRVALRLELIEESATNQWSSRTLQERERIRGKDVPTPPALLQKALRPPHRLHEIMGKPNKDQEFTLKDVEASIEQLANSSPRKFGE
jgi:hypothetical protein